MSILLYNNKLLTRESRKSYLKLRKHRLQHATSTSFKFAESEMFKDDKWVKRATEGIKTFLTFGHPTQLRFCSKRSGCCCSSWEVLKLQFKSCILTHPFKLTWVKWVQQARSSSMEAWHKLPYDKSSSRKVGRAPSL